jgi:hypothetical protein
MPAATAPTRAGYTFGGYYTAAGGAGTQYYTAAMASARNWDIAANTTLYAYWTAATYSVTYNGNGNTAGSTPGDQTKTHDVTLVLRTNTGALARTGYAFSGWNTAANGTGTDYAEGGNYTANAAATMYAKWTGNAYTVTFDKQSGTGGSDNVSAIYGSAMPAATSPTRTGYTFGGYYTSENGTGTQYYTAAMASARNWDIAAATTLYANWTVATYAVTYNGNGNTSGTAPADQIKTYDVALTLRANTGALARTGYTFSGWNTAANGTGTDYAEGASYTANLSVTLYSKWISSAIGTGISPMRGSSPSVTTTTTNPPVALPSIYTQSASLSAATVTPGTPVTVTAFLGNRGTVNGNKKVTVYVNGQEEAAQGVTVNSGGSAQLAFDISRSEPGEYSVYVDGTPAGSFRVETFRESDLVLLFSITALAMAFIAGVIMLRRRQQGH